VHLKKLHRAEGGTKIFGVFRVKNHDFTPKNHIFFNFRGGTRQVHPPPPGIQQLPIIVRPWTVEQFLQMCTPLTKTPSILINIIY
jgi:hypothetical protein